MQNANQAEMRMYKARPDLWAVSRVLKHCKGSNLAKYCWDSMTDEDKRTLSHVSDGRWPEGE